MAIRGVLFDFSGTMFRLFQDGGAWRATDHDDRPVAVSQDDHAAAHDERAVSQDEQIELLRALTAPVGTPDGITGELRAAWADRDLDPVAHRRAYTALLGDSGLAGDAAHRLYDRLLAVESWSPYPDAASALRRLSAAAVPVGVLSNIAWDIEPVFAAHGLADLVRAFVLSYQVGRVKPDPELFRAACAAIGTEPAETLMIGDSPEADGGAADIGCPVVIVDPLPVTQRPRALLAALDKYGIA